MYKDKLDCSYTNKFALNQRDWNPYRMRELDEVRGDLVHVEEAEGGIIILIDKIPILLPAEMAGKLQGLIGRRLGLLRLEGYHVRCLNK
jgi:hypothetical protein